MMKKVISAITFAFSILSLSATSLGNLGDGVAASDAATGTGYILFNPDGVGDNRPVLTGASPNFIAVYWDSTVHKWHYFEDDVAKPFTPELGDTLVADVNFDTDTVALISGIRGSEYGIAIGYDSGDLAITENQYNNAADPGQFELSGTQIELNKEPVWWWERAVINGNISAVNDYTTVNLGQAKWIVKNALEVIEKDKPNLAFYIRNGLVGPSETHPFSSWPPVVGGATDRAPLSLGQLKAISAPFYHGVNQFAPIWLENEMNFVETRQSGWPYPWGAGVGVTRNKAVANLGQLKALFSMRFLYLPSSVDLDTDGDGLPDDWEIAHGYDPLLRDSSDPINGIDDGDEDKDGDGLSNLFELFHGLDPLLVSSIPGGVNDGLVDREMDGRLDGVESTYLPPEGPSDPALVDNPKVKLVVTPIP